MRTPADTEAFRAGFSARWAELHAAGGQTKEAAGLARAVGGGLMRGGKALLSGGRNLVNKAVPPKAPISPMAESYASGAAPTPAGGLLGKAVGGAADWAKRNPVGAASAAGGTLLGSNALTANKVKDMAQNRYMAEGQNAIQTLQSSAKDYWSGMGGDSFLGRLMILLNILFGGQNALQSMQTGILQQAAQNSGTSPVNQQLFNRMLQPKPLAPAPAQPTA